MSQIPVAVLHAKRLSCEGIAHLLRTAGFTVFAADTGLDDLLQRRTEAGKPSVIIVWLAEYADAIAGTLAAIKTAFPQADVILLADQFINSMDIGEAHAAGASGFLTTDASSAVLVEYIRLVALGIDAFPAPLPSIATEPPEPEKSAYKNGTYSRLSEREEDILQCVAGGLSNKAIARRLLITESTVKAHVRSILRKMGASNRTQAAVWARTATGENSD